MGTKSEGEASALERITEWRGRDLRQQHPLDLSGLGLIAVPESVRKLHDLRILGISQNYIRDLPYWIGELRDLEVINVSNNLLRKVPDELGALQNLEALWLANNRLRSLPESLQQLQLRRLVVHGNSGLRLPESILERPPTEILQYYFESRAEGRPLKELKLLLVGRGKAGKTTLVKRLAGERTDENEQETHSISIREFDLHCPSGVVRAHAWDFGGQEILHSTHQFFLSERSLYFVVLEPRTGLAQRDAEYWLRLIDTQGAGSPVIVVLNWSHDRRWRIDEIKLRRKFPFIVDVIATDALRGEGIDALYQAMVATVQVSMHDVWLPFPRRWREIKDAVATMQQNFLTYREYKNLCVEHGERSTKAQAFLAQTLNTLGLALYFGADRRLHDTRVLNPSWVTGGVYAVIRSPSVARDNGQLAISDMPQVLREAEAAKSIRVADYPKQTHPFILELMRAFQLCYASEEVEGKPTRYLVPELLPEFEPAMSQDWESAEVRLRYRYEASTPGLLSRFIVRTHALSDGSPRWRYGVVLRHGDALALIREESDKPELHLFVFGGAADARSVLVAMVRRELETLHAEMKVQPIEELALTSESELWIGVRALREVEQDAQPEQKLPVQPEGTALVNVPRELDKIVPASARAIDRDPSTAPVSVRLFVSYAHDDERQLKRLDAILDVLEQQHGLTAWRDQRLIAGEAWDAEIRKRLEEMDIFLFVASAASLVRPYIRDPELKRAKERHAAGEVQVVAVKLEPCASDEDEYLGKLQRLAPRFKSVAETALKSKVWEQVRKDLLPVIERARKQSTAARRTSAT